MSIITKILQPESIVDLHLYSTTFCKTGKEKVIGRSPQEKKGCHQSGGKGDVVYYLPISKKSLCLISGFFRKTDSARFEDLLIPATRKFTSHYQGWKSSAGEEIGDSFHNSYSVRFDSVPSNQPLFSSLLKVATSFWRVGRLASRIPQTISSAMEA